MIILNRLFNKQFRWIGVWFLVACSSFPLQKEPPVGIPSVEPPAAPDLKASNSPDPLIFPSPSLSPSPAPVSPSVGITPTPVQEATPSVVPSVSLPTPSAASWPDPIVVDITSISGTIFDDSGKPLPGATISVFVYGNNDKRLLAKQETVIGGKYRFINAPLGMGMLLVASKPGYTTRQRLVVARSSRASEPITNRHDFGNVDASPNGNNYDGTIYNALSNKPEISSVLPEPDSVQQAPNPAITLKFSEPMDKESVEKYLVIRSAESSLLSVDSQTPGSETFQGSQNQEPGSLIWDRSAFDATWNPEEDEVTFHFKPGYQLPMDKTSKLKYEVTFSGSVQDKSGIAQDGNLFRLKHEQAATPGYFFSISPDIQAPVLSSVTSTATGITLTYSEPMIIHTLSRAIAGGLDDRFSLPGSEKKAPAKHPENQGNATARTTAQNYTLKIMPGANSSTQPLELSWFDLGGICLYDTLDPAKVQLRLPQNTSGAEIPRFIPAKTQAVMKASSAITVDTHDNSLWQFGWKLVKPDGSLSAQFLTSDLETAQQPENATSLATALVAELNDAALTTQLNPPTSPQPWTVIASEDAQSLKLVFDDTRRNYSGWQFTGGIYTLAEEDRLPADPLFSGSQTWASGAPLKLWSPGDSVQVTVSPTVVDPAGNPLSAEKNTATVLIQ